jgi:hypothetical protein
VSELVEYRGLKNIEVVITMECSRDPKILIKSHVPVRDSVKAITVLLEAVMVLVEGVRVRVESIP